MSRGSAASLPKIWGGDEAQESASLGRGTTTGAATVVALSAAPKSDVGTKFYKEGSTVVESRPSITMYKAQGLPIRNLGTQYIAVPISSAATPTKMSPFKTEPTILPKTVHLQNSPVILSSPQRVVAGAHLVNATSQRTPQHFVSPAVEHRDTWSGKRYHEYETYDSKRNKKSDKGGKGLRHFSMKVCEKVQKKGTTSYNEVADELVAEFSSPRHRSTPSDQAYDQKNIRRRVYDALNVLMAMNIISKEKKEIKWLGLPTNSAQECQNLEVEKQRRLDRIRVKSQQLQDLIVQQIAFKNLVERNKASESVPSANSIIQLPFIIVNTSKKTVIDCSISSDKSEYLFTFDNTFEIHDDIEVLKRMGLSLQLDRGTCTPEDLEKAKKMVPKALEAYVVQMAKGEAGLEFENIGQGRPSFSRKLQTAVASTSSADSDVEATMVINETPRLSRQSSVGSSSDLHSRPGTSSASEEDYTDSDSDMGD